MWLVQQFILYKAHTIKPGLMDIKLPSFAIRLHSKKVDRMKARLMIYASIMFNDHLLNQFYIENK